MIRYIDAERGKDPVELEYWQKKGVPTQFVPEESGFWATPNWAFFWGFREGYPLNRRRTGVKKRPYVVRLRKAD